MDLRGCIYILCIHICNNNNHKYTINLKKSEENIGIGERKHRQGWIEEREEGKKYNYILITKF